MFRFPAEQTTNVKRAATISVRNATMIKKSSSTLRNLLAWPRVREKYALQFRIFELTSGTFFLPCVCRQYNIYIFFGVRFCFEVTATVFQGEGSEINIGTVIFESGLSRVRIVIKYFHMSRDLDLYARNGSWTNFIL